MDRLTPLATAFLDAEDADPTASLAIGSLAVFEGPAPSYEEFLTHLAGRLPLIPRYRQRLRRAPFDIAAPAWVDDEHFDLRWHLRQTAVPPPGGRDEVGNLMSRVMTRRMDRSRPLWEYWLCQGLEGGRWALLSKLHHCLVDGVSGTDLYRLVLDPGPEPRGGVPDEWEPVPEEPFLRFTAAAVRDLVTTPAVSGRAVVGALRSPRRLLRGTATTTRGLLTFTGAVPPAQRSSLTGTLDGSRRYAWTDVSLGDIRAVRRAFGVTVNDVALAAVTGGFRRLLLSRGEEPSPHALRSLVPVSTRASGLESVPDNRVSLMLPYLPVDVAEPRDRLLEVRKRVSALRAGAEPEVGEEATTVAGWGLFPLVSWGMRMGLRYPQQQITTVTTNVPGPRSTMYGLGREAVAMLPYVPIADRVRIGVAMFSYRDTLTFGITADYDSTPDLQVLADGIAHSMAVLVDEAVTESP